MSLSEIGEATGRHPQSVKWWVVQHGLRLDPRDADADRVGLVREELEPLVEAGHSVEQIAQELGVSDDTARHWLRRFDLRTRPVGRRYRRNPPEARALPRIERECGTHGLVEHVRESDRYRCVRCRSEAVGRRRRKVKRMLVDEAGGACSICGYDRFIGALHFHHLDPATKSFSLGVRGITRGIDQLRAEAAKCALLCANCHAEVEAGITAPPGRIHDLDGTPV